jgi:hypothetical protein
MKVYKSEIVFPIRFENSLVAKPHNCLAPLLALAGARSGGVLGWSSTGSRRGLSTVSITHGSQIHATGNVA